MRKILFIIGLSFLVSCSNDDDSSSNNSELIDFSFPLAQNKYWTYNVDNEGTISRDSLYINSIETVNGKQQAFFKTLNDVAVGFYSNSLRNNYVREEGNLLYLTGQLNTSQYDLPVDLNLNVTDFILLKKNGTNNELQDTDTGIIQQTINSIPLDINYTLKSYFVENLTSYTTTNNTYSDIKKVKIILTLKMTTTQTIGGFPITITYLPEQDVIISNQYIAKNIGVIYADTNLSYTIDSTIASNLGIPATFNSTQTETLDTHN